MMKKVTAFVALTLTILFLATSLFPKEIDTIVKNISRLGLLSFEEEDLQTVNYTISSSNLQPGQTVRYKIYTEDISGNWDVSEVKSFAVEESVGETTSTITTTTIEKVSEGISSESIIIIVLVIITISVAGIILYLRSKRSGGDNIGEKTEKTDFNFNYFFNVHFSDRS